MLEYYIPRNNSMKKRPIDSFSTQEQQEIIDLYLSGKSAYYIATSKNTYPSYISQILKSKQISMRSIKERTFRKYFVDENYFNEMNSNDKFWVLGLLYSDGYNYTNKNNKNFSLCFHKNDLECLEKVKSCIKYSGEIKQHNNKNAYYLTVNSVVMSDKLDEMGCVQAKSFVLKWPNINMNQEQSWHFLRGIWDGDGSIKLRKHKGISRRGIKVELSSASLEFLSNVKQFIDKIDIKNKIIHTDKTSRCQRLIINGTYKNSLKFLNMIYSNCGELKMMRKYKEYQEFKEILPEREI